MTHRKILLIISGGIAAYKSLELIRALRKEGYEITPVLTEAAAQFVTPLSVSALCGKSTHHDLFDIEQETQMGHIELSRACDLVLVVPATANLLAKMAHGLADDLASTLLLATDKPVMVAPAMNVKMWEHPATRRNMALLQQDGIQVIEPEIGLMACGEHGAGRLAELSQITASVDAFFSSQDPQNKPLTGRHIIVTSGPTHEPIDPVRYIANRSSGAQGTEIAKALTSLGADVTFITGPAEIPPPSGAKIIRIETAKEMLRAVEAALPADAAICTAAVADWAVDNASDQKMKKNEHGLPELKLSKNPDILQTLSNHATLRPQLVIGFAAETEQLDTYARAKLTRKGCDLIVANDVSSGSGVMGGRDNEVTLYQKSKDTDTISATPWPRMSKAKTAQKLADHIAKHFTP